MSLLSWNKSDDLRQYGYQYWIGSTDTLSHTSPIFTFWEIEGGEFHIFSTQANFLTHPHITGKFLLLSHSSFFLINSQVKYRRNTFMGVMCPGSIFAKCSVCWSKCFGGKWLICWGVFSAVQISTSCGVFRTFPPKSAVWFLSSKEWNFWWNKSISVLLDSAL